MVPGELGGMLGKYAAAHGGELASALERASEVRFQVLLRVFAPASGRLNMSGNWPGNWPGSSLGEPSAELTFRTDAEYFYPASMVKVPIAVAAMRTSEELAIQSGGKISPDTPFRLFDRAGKYVSPVASRVDGELASEAPDVVAWQHSHDCFSGLGDDVERSLIISDNPASNRLHELAGAPGLAALAQQGIMINHRLSDFRSAELQREFLGVEFVGREKHGSNDQVLLTVPPHTGELPSPASDLTVGLRVGRAYIDPLSGERVDGPFDFALKNRCTLRALLTSIEDASLLAAAPSASEWSAIIAQSMAARSHLGRRLRFDHQLFPAKHYKWLGSEIGAHLATYSNKVGRAYGFSTEAAVFVPKESSLPVVSLAATMLTCAGGVLNADEYEYDRADAVFTQIGRCVAQYLWA